MKAGTTATALLLCFAMAGAALAAEYDPQPLPRTSLTLEEALIIGLDNSPDVFLADQATIFRRGSLQTAGGLFDSVFNFVTTASHREGELLPTSVLQEEAKRRRFRLLADSLGQAADQLEDQFSAQIVGVVQCPDEVIFEINDNTVCVSAEDARRAQNINDVLRGLGFPLGLDDQLAENLLFRTPNQVVRQLIDSIQVIRQVEADLRAQERDLGVVPDTEIEEALNFDLTLTKPFRNGMALSGVIMLESLEDNFDDKPLFRNFERSNPLTGAVIINPETGLPVESFTLGRFGGKGRPNTFISTIGVILDAPLGRGAGRKSAQAAERAAELDLAAAEESRVHTSSLVALDVILDYWSLVAAQQRLQLLERSRAEQERLDGIVGRLIEGEEMPAIERARTRANIAQALSAEAQARQSVGQARLQLARTLGVRTLALDQAPVAAEGFPEVPESVGVSNVAGMIADVLEQRSDYQSTVLRSDALVQLEEAARRDLLPVFDLKLEVGAQSLFESPNSGGRDPNCRVDPNIDPPMAPPASCGSDLDVIQWYNPEGHFKALIDEYANPAFRLTVNLELPFRNRRQKGRYLQSKARRRQAEIQEGDLARTIQAQAVDLAGELEEAVNNVNELLASASAYREALDGDMQLFRSGEVDVIDTLLTEQQLTRAELALIDARLTYAILLARLRFEVGALVRVEGDGDTRTETVYPYGYDFGF